jgi:hypothetical protein
VSDASDEPREDATVTPPTLSMRLTPQPIRITVRQHGWSVWAQIAIDHERDARRSRETDLTTVVSLAPDRSIRRLRFAGCGWVHDPESARVRTCPVDRGSFHL